MSNSESDAVTFETIPLLTYVGRKAQYIRRHNSQEANEDTPTFNIPLARLVMEGITASNQRLKIETNSMRTDVFQHQVTLHRDYDSILGFYPGIPLFETIDITAVPWPTHRLLPS